VLLLLLLSTQRPQ